MSSDFKNFVRRLKFEALALAVLMWVLALNSSYTAWWLLITFPLFDIGALGYLVNPKIGAKTYNFMHDFTVPTLLVALGVVSSNGLSSIIGICWIFHIAVDRALGYGLKHQHSFKETHLGRIGKK